MTQQLRKINQSLRDLCNDVKRELSLDFYCHAVAKVVTFNPLNQTITAEIAYGQEYLQRDPRSGKYVTTLVKYPLLVDVPVVIMGGGGATLTFPIATGDECLLLFNDRDIDNWYAGTSGGAVASDRLHSFSDAFALIGVRSKLKALENYDQTRAALSHEAGGKIGVRDRIVVKNATVDLKTQLDLLLQGLAVFASTTSGATTASQIATAAGILVPIVSNVKIQLDLLFETETP